MSVGGIHQHFRGPKPRGPRAGWQEVAGTGWTREGWPGWRPEPNGSRDGWRRLGVPEPVPSRGSGGNVGPLGLEERCLLVLLSCLGCVYVCVCVFSFLKNCGFTHKIL